MRGPQFCRAYSEVADAWLAGLLGDEHGVALLAVGGHGRAELCPGSDLDLVLVHAGRRDIRAVADRLWYPIWDAGIGLDHSVRTVKEVLAVAADDLKVALGLIDGRLVAGDPELAVAVLVGARAQWHKRAGRSLALLHRAILERHDAAGEVAFLLEPDLKEGKGGLRDVHAMRAAAVAAPVVPEEDPAVSLAHDTLLAVRVELHRHTGKAVDRLLLQEQEAVAAVLGYADADALMTAVSAAARTIAWESDDAWRRVAAWLEGPKGRVAVRDQPLGPGLFWREGEVVMAPDAAPSRDPSLVLRAGAAAAESGAPLSRATLDHLAAEAPPLGDPWPEAARRALVALLGSGTAAVPVLEALDQKGLLVRILPEWAMVRCRPQRNAYHRFTVDRHLCESAVVAAALTRRVARPDLLLVGAWLHDIGKGLPGDHTVTGVRVVRRIAARMGFPPADVEALGALVRHHLLLSEVATRRDLDDPQTIEAVAEAVGDENTLELLAALTEADSLATGPAAWGSWKAGLVEELVRRTGRLLEHGVVQLPPGFPSEAHLELMARGELVVEGEGSTLTVVAPDRPGLFCRVAGTLVLHGLDVRSASGASDESGMVVYLFEVEHAFGQPPEWDRVHADLVRSLTGRLSIEARLAERVRAYAGRRRASAARAAEPRVLFDNEASEAATVVEVRAPDVIGVLYRITRALTDCDLDLRSAKVATLGHEVVDAFYVRDLTGAKVTDPEHLREIERAVLAELARLG